MKYKTNCIWCIFTLTLFLWNKSYAQNKDYTEYHRLINKAEFCYFNLYNVDSSIKYYNIAFQSYDYVFIRDALNASQIAFYYKDPHYSVFIKKAVSVGFNIKYIDSFPIFKASRSLINSSLRKECDSIYETYLKKIDRKSLSKVIEAFIFDQQKKITKHTEYEKIKSILIKDIIHSIESKKVPTEKNIGLFDEELFKRKILDSNMFKYMTDLYQCADYFHDKNLDFCSDYLYIILIHNFDTYPLLEPYFHQLIANGDLHPRTIGLLFDNMYRVSLEYKYNAALYKIAQSYFSLNYFTKAELLIKYKKESFATDITINKNRASYGINTIEIDRIKETYEQKYGFRFRYGFNKHL